MTINIKRVGNLGLTHKEKALSTTLAQVSGAEEFNPARGAVAYLEGGRTIWYAMPKVKVLYRTPRVARIEMDYDVGNNTGQA